MAPNPNPSRITDASWWLMEQLKALQPGTENGGIYANKRGYHNTRAANRARWPDDYSIRDEEDQGGPDDKAAAYDWTFTDAQAGRYRTIALYSRRLLASGQDPADPRLDGWREFFGQTDDDRQVEGWDFRRDRASSSDSSHLWHIHLSEDRDKVTDLRNKEALLSVLRGQPLEEWLNPAPPPPVRHADVGSHLVGVNADGRLEVFVVGTDGGLHHRWQTAPNNGWSGWASLGGQDLALSVDIGVTRNADGRLEVFARDAAGTLRHIWQTAPNGGWSGWAGLGTQRIGVPVPARNDDGRLEVFTVASDGVLWHVWQTAPNNGWSGWAALPGATLSTEPVVAQNADGRLEVFALDAAGTLRHIWQTAPNNGWSGWASLGGEGLTSPVVANNQDGRLEVFALDGDAALRHVWQTAPNNGWSGWAGLGGENFAEPVAAERNQDGRLEVFALDGEGVLRHVWQTAPNNGWSGFDTLGVPE